MHPWWLLGLCYLGALTHPLLDLQTTYSVQLLSPLSGRWFHSDSLFIIDPWLWLLIDARHRRGRRASSSAAGAITAARSRPRSGLPSPTSASTSASATPPNRERAQARARSNPDLRLAPANGVLEARHGVARGGLIGRAKWRMFGGLSRNEPLVGDNMRDPIVRAALDRDWRLRKFLYWSILPIAKVERHGCAARVIIADARYGLPEANKARLYRDSTIDVCAPTRLANGGARDE